MSAALNNKLRNARDLLQSGDPGSAHAICTQILAKAPRNPEALTLRGIAALMGGAPTDAARDFRQALATTPRDAALLEYLGLALLHLGEFAEAGQHLHRATTISGAPASAWMRLGLALLHQGRATDALPPLQRAVALAPGDVDCRLNLGQALARTGNMATARSEIEAALRLDPGRTDALFNLGVIEMEQDHLPAAEQWFGRVIEQDPGQADAYVNLGIIHQKQQRLDAATACLRRALELNPASAAAGNNLAHTLALQNQLEAARGQFLATLAMAPDWVEAHEGLAAVCRKLGRLKECIAHLRRLIELGAGSGAIWTSLAEALFQSGDIAAAETAAQRAHGIDGAMAGPYSVLGLVHIVRGEAERAIAVLDAGWRRTGAGGLLGTLAHQLQRACDWPRWHDAWQELSRRLDHDADLGSPFWLLMTPATAAQQLAYTRRWAQAQFGSGATLPPPGDMPAPGTDRRLRIGYLSSDLHEHATAHLFAGVLEQHDRGRFEIFAYSYGPEDGSGLRARVKNACEHFIDIAWDPDDLVVRRIRDDALDILVDLKGYTLGARTAILARRPCAIQVNWLGYPGTMGAPFIDFLLTDDYIVPPGAESAYSEHIIRLHHCWQCNDRQRPRVEPLTRAEYGLPETGFVFCCFTQSVKITPEIYSRWMNLLRRVPGSVLWLAADNPLATANLQAAARAHGIAPERVVFSPRLAFAPHLARYRVADLALDTYPYTSHSTASDALWSGCPLVALCGDTFAARVSASILTHGGLPELITHTPDDYEELAYRLASDPALLREMRARVAAAGGSALFDAAAFARDLERVYMELAASRTMAE